MMGTDIVIVGAGICGVLAAQQCIERGFTFTILERKQHFGGVWSFRANRHSHLQAYACLYQWHRNYPLHTDPFSKLGSQKVLQLIQKFAEDFKLAEHTCFGQEVLSIKPEGSRYQVMHRDCTSGLLTSSSCNAILVATGILGEQCTPKSRNIRGMQDFGGVVTFAGQHEGSDSKAAARAVVEDKHVVILGSGAFGLEAMEAAHKAGARSIIMLTRARDRWIVPYSEQFKLVARIRNPFQSKARTCTRVYYWLQKVYQEAGISFMAPAPGSAHNFTGQCNDAFFQLAKQGHVRYIVEPDGRTQILADSILTAAGERIPADVIVVALGCEVLYKPSFLQDLKLDYSMLHDYSFLGRNPRIGTASDWVWFNVPHGPQKQIACFLHAYSCFKQGLEEEFRAQMRPTPFSGCKGESFTPNAPDGMRVREGVYCRTMAVGRSPIRKVTWHAWHHIQAVLLWLFLEFVSWREWYHLRHWLSVTHDSIGKQT